MKNYQQILLYIYPKLERFIDDIQSFINYKAVHSYHIQLKVEKSIDKMLDVLEQKRKLILAKELLTKVFEEFSDEEKFILEYKFFRRKEVLFEKYKNFVLKCSSRTYYRKQKRVESKVHALFMQNAIDEKWFLQIFKSISSVMQLYTDMQKGKLQLIDKRRYKELALKKAS